MADHATTRAVQLYLDELAQDGSSAAAPVIQKLLERSAGRLHLLCDSMLKRSYPRLMRPPLNLQSEELLSGVMERLLKALQQIQPGTVRQFFALANRHLRWELDDLARRLDEQRIHTGLNVDVVATPESHGSELSADARVILEAIENLPPELQEVFDLVRIQGFTHAEAANVLQVSTKTVQRRLASSLMLLTKTLSELRVRTDGGLS
ncbi:RNA polymerase sigma factor [Planctomicrobium piriforme]|uniref:RNA polymerase sigma-70 factor, ECF subfamily n=1 Tax=Planctomicrobium piriforme TaxID=1576369 RepID=A0A1I3CG36_9PLAN|nr:sigma-70 family RNA polymerase sigma factor [Planctomicrobium piriforme]SFH73445.1 RNA polymerase sigma-70 factor, ECF subfamily [Planctomicrobium piriforme]